MRGIVENCSEHTVTLEVNKVAVQLSSYPHRGSAFPDSHRCFGRALPEATLYFIRAFAEVTNTTAAERWGGISRIVKDAAPRFLKNCWRCHKCGWRQLVRSGCHHYKIGRQLGGHSVVAPAAPIQGCVNKCLRIAVVHIECRWPLRSQGV